MNSLLLNKELYPVNIIEKGISDYKSLATITYINKDCHYALSFDDCLYDEKLTIKEFENYMIGLIVSKKG